MCPDNALFVEVSEITIRNLGCQPKFRPVGGNYRVIIEHEHGTKEAISSGESGAEVSIKCKIFIQLDSEATVHVYRAKKFQSEADGTLTLSIIAAEDEEYTINLTGKREMSLILKLGKKMTATQVAEARLQDANRVLEQRAKSAEELERVTGHVKCMMGALDMAASFDPFPFAGGVVKIVQLVFEKIEITHKDYNALKNIALDCMAQIRFDEEARKVFTTEAVRKQLNVVMALVLKALDFVLAYYSQSRIDWFNSILTKPSDSTSAIDKVKGLISELNREKEQTKNFFQLEIRGILQKLMEDPLLKQYLSTTGNVAQGKEPCIPGTRVSILQQLSSWAQNESPEASRLFWLYGVAGCGKSAVAVSISKALDEVDRLGGSFFCRRDEASRRRPDQLYARLASFLTEKSPAFRVAIVESLTRYHRLDDKSESTFVEYALMKPLSKTWNCAPPTPFIFIIDALDECMNSGIVACILAKIVVETPWIKLVVTSREYPEIKKAFLGVGIPAAHHDLFAGDARGDVDRYLLQSLSPFPDLDSYVAKLAEKSGGLFIWLHTVTEIIINTKLEMERKEKVQAFIKQPLFGDAASRMADTYLLVLQQASGSEPSERVTAIVRMITGLLFVTSTSMPLTISGLYKFLPPHLARNLSLEEFRGFIMELKPVLKLTSAEQNSDETTVDRYRLVVQTHHASFLDFCERQTIPRRMVEGVELSLPNPFWTDPIILHREMAMGCLDIMMKGSRWGKPDDASLGLRFNMCNLTTSHKMNSDIDDLSERIAANISSHLLYSSLYWPSHVLKSSLGEISDSDKTNLEGMLDEFFESTHSLLWLEALSLTGNLPTVIDSLLKIAERAEEEALSRISETAYEMSQFIEQYFPAISTSTPHLYLSLSWLPIESLLWRAWKAEFAGASILKTPIQRPSELLSSTPFPVRVDVFALSTDGKYVTTGSRDGYVRLWNMHSGSVIGERQITAPVGALAYEPSGSQILCVCDSFIYKLNTESLLDIEDREALPCDNIRCMAIVHSQVTFGTEDGRVIVSTPAKTYSEVKFHKEGRIDAIALSPDGSRLVYASDNIYYGERDVRGGVYKPVVDYLKSYNSWVTALAFSPNGKKFVIGEWSGYIQLFDVECGERIGAFDVNSPIQFLAFSYGNRIIAAGATKSNKSDSKDLPLRSKASRIYNFPGYHCWAEETSLQIWNVDSSRRQQTQSAGHIFAVNSVVFSPDAKRIVSGSSDNSVQVWDAQTGEQVKLAEMEHSDWVSFVTFSPDGNFIASGGDDKVVRIWDAQTGKPVQVLEGHTGEILCGAYSPDGTRLVSGSGDKKLRVWNVETENITSEELSGHMLCVESITFSPDGSLLASASCDSTIRIWDYKSWKALGNPLTGHCSGVHSVAFSPDGRRLVSGGDDNTVRVWDVRTSSAVGEPLKGHTFPVTSVAFSLDGTCIFSTSEDRTIRCWETITGNPIGHPLEGHSSSLRTLAVSPDGRLIVSGSNDGTIRAWDSQCFNWEVDTSFITCGHCGPDKIPNHIPEDGWIRTSEGRLLLWVPVEHRMAVCELYEFAISRDDKLKSNHILWDELCYGEKWTDIRHAKSK